MLPERTQLCAAFSGGAKNTRLLVAPEGRNGQYRLQTEAISEGAACVVSWAADPTHRLVAEIETGLGPEGAVVDAARRRAYVASARSHQLTVIDLDRLEAIGSIAVGHEPTDVALDEDGGRLFACDLRSATVSVIDLETERVEGSVSVPGYPAAVTVDPARRQLYCGCAAGAAVAVIDIDSLKLLATIPAELGAGGIAVDARRQRAYCANFLTSSVTVIDIASRTPIGRLEVGHAPCSATVAASTRSHIWSGVKVERWRCTSA